jgi:hypothetical protein
MDRAYKFLMRTSLVVACCLTLAACSAEPQPASSAVPPSAAALPSAAVPSLVVSAKPSPSYPTDLKDCADGRCEVLLTTSGRLTPNRQFDIALITLTHVDPDRLEYVVIRADGSTVNGYVGGKGRLSMATGPTINVVRHDRDGALLRFDPKPLDRKNDIASGSGAAIYDNR